MNQNNVVVSGGLPGTKVSVVERDNKETVNFEFRSNGALQMNGDTAREIGFTVVKRVIDEKVWIEFMDSSSSWGRSIQPY